MLCRRALRSDRAADPRRQHQLRAELAGELAERLDHHVGLLLAVEPADVDQQRLLVGETQLVPQLRVAPARTELAELDFQRHDLDVVDSEGPELGRAAIAAEREHRIEAPVERPAIGIAEPAEHSADHPAEHLRQRPLDIDRRKIRHIGGDQRRFRPALAMRRSPSTADCTHPGTRSGRAGSAPAPPAPRRCAASTGNACFPARAARRW